MENQKPKNPNAFPLSSYAIERGVMQKEDTPSGMTLRDYFAAKAVTGFLKSSMIMQQPFGRDLDAKAAAKMAYEVADRMLSEREK